jgi:hypothetical protein
MIDLPIMFVDWFWTVIKVSMGIFAFVAKVTPKHILWSVSTLAENKNTWELDDI